MPPSGRIDRCPPDRSASVRLPSGADRECDRGQARDGKSDPSKHRSSPSDPSGRSFSLRGSVHERGHHGFQRAPAASSNAARVAPVKNTYRQSCLRICPSPSSLFRSREDAPFAPTAPSGDRPLFTSAVSSVVMNHLPRPKGPRREAPPGFAGGRLASSVRRLSTASSPRRPPSLPRPGSRAHT